MLGLFFFMSKILQKVFTNGKISAIIKIRKKKPYFATTQKNDLGEYLCQVKFKNI